jgi:hypothetical protein
MDEINSPENVGFSTSPPASKTLLTLGIIAAILTTLTVGAAYFVFFSKSKLAGDNKPAFSIISVKVENGDIVVVKNDKESKITSWGYNSSPVLSPDKTKIAYLSKSKESLENEKVDVGYVRTSTNVWLTSTDGTNSVQLTNHKDFVYRDNLHWLDDDRLIFTDGEKTVRLYSVSDKTFRTLLGPEEAVGRCMDACGYTIEYQYTDDFAYLIRLAQGFTSATTAVIDLKTLKSVEVKEQFETTSSIDYDATAKTITFKANTVPDYKQVLITINLVNGTVAKN